MNKKLALFLDFIPWFVFSEVYTPTTLGVIKASIAAIIVSLILDWQDIKKLFWLPIASLIYFVLISVNAVFDVSPWLISHPAIVVNLAIAIIIWLSLIINKPFTMQYAKEETPPTFWKSPLFIRVNQYLTLLWAVSLSISALPGLFIPEKVYSASLFWNYGLNVICFAIPIFFKDKFIDWIIANNFWQTVKTLPPVNSPFLQNGYAPIHSEIYVDNLEVVGEIPLELNGSYLRNGPNPYFTPYTYTYPIDGDGMIHQISIKNGQASYKNAFVMTNGLKSEIKAGKALYGGINLPIPPDPRLVSDKNLNTKEPANIHVIKWKNNLLALYESAPAYLLNTNLETIQEWKPESISDNRFSINAHHRVDKKTGMIYMFSYDIEKDPLVIHEFNSEYELVRTKKIDKDRISMIHDFVITDNYIIVFDFPAIFNTDNMANDNFLTFEESLAVTIFLIKRSDFSVTTIENIPSFFVYHFVNAYEENNKIIVDMAHYEKLFLGNADTRDSETSKLYRGIIDLDNNSYTHNCLCQEYIVEFPQYNLEYCGQAYRYCYLPIEDPNTALFHSIMKYDFQTNNYLVFDFGNNFELSEPTFIPKANAESEDDGYLVFFIYNSDIDKSDFVICNAKDLSEIARIKIPQRLPNGLHGGWISDL